MEEIPMKISVDRLCKLAGVESPASGRLTEGSNRSFHDDPYYQDEAGYRYGHNQLSEDAEPAEEAEELPEGMEGFMAEEEDTHEGEPSMSELKKALILPKKALILLKRVSTKILTK